MTPVDICNLALDQISARTSITGIDPASPPNNLAAQVASRNYQIQAESVFQAAHWNAARKQKPLALLKAARGTPENPDGSKLPIPPYPWTYSYAYPADALTIRFVMPLNPEDVSATQPPLMTNLSLRQFARVNTAMPFVPAVDEDRDGNEISVILTNARAAEAVYTGWVSNVDMWGTSLRNAVIGTLAAWFVMPLTGDKALLAARVQLAVGLIQTARVSDGNEGITSSDLPVDWMLIRGVGGGFGDRFGGPAPFIASWQQIIMPNGMSY